MERRMEIELWMDPKERNLILKYLKPEYHVITEYYDVIDSVQDTLQTIVALKKKDTL